MGSKSVGESEFVGANSASPLFGDDVGASSASPEYTKTFNSDGRIEAFVDGNGVTTTFTYDVNGNIINEEKSDGDFAISRSFVYNDFGSKLSETDFNGNTTTYTYDAKNNLIKIIDARGNTEEMTYDNLSRMTSKKDKNGNITRYRYTGNNPKPSEVEQKLGTGLHISDTFKTQNSWKKS